MRLPAQAGLARGRQAARAGQGGRDLHGRLGRRAHRALGRDALDPVPQGPEGTNWFYTLGSASLFAFLSQAVWATIVAANITGTGPFVGPFLADFLRGGAEFGATTLSRFYAIHMLLLPGAIVPLIGAHIYLVTRLGITAPPWQKAESGNGIREERV